MMKIPLYKQEFSWSCLATCVKMVLEYYGVIKQERDLRILLKTTPSYGTIWDYAEREIKRIGFELVWKKFWNLDNIVSLVKQSIPVIVGVKREGEIHGHAMIVVDISERYVEVADPQNGELVTLHKEDFLELWTGRANIAGYIKKI